MGQGFDDDDGSSFPYTSQVEAQLIRILIILLYLSIPSGLFVCAVGIKRQKIFCMLPVGAIECTGKAKDLADVPLYCSTFVVERSFPREFLFGKAEVALSEFTFHIDSFFFFTSYVLVSFNMIGLLVFS